MPLRGYPEGDTEGFPVLDIAVDGGIEVVPAMLPETFRAAPTIDESAVSEVRQFDLSMGMGTGMMGGMGGGGMGGGRGGGGMGGQRGGGGMQGRGPRGFTINGVSMDMSVINETVKLGAIEEWRITNHSTMTHPFHVHDVQFLVRSRNDMRAENDVRPKHHLCSQGPYASGQDLQPGDHLRTGDDVRTGQRSN